MIIVIVVAPNPSFFYVYPTFPMSDFHWTVLQIQAASGTVAATAVAHPWSVLLMFGGQGGACEGRIHMIYH